jgi:hypothetical protein
MLYQSRWRTMGEAHVRFELSSGTRWSHTPRPCPPAWPRVSLPLQLSTYCSIDKVQGVFLFSGNWNLILFGSLNVVLVNILNIR